MTVTGASSFLSKMVNALIHASRNPGGWGVDGRVEPGHDGNAGLVIPDLIRNPGGLGRTVLPVRLDPLITISCPAGAKRTSGPAMR